MAISAVSQLPLGDLTVDPYFMTSTPNSGNYVSNKISYLAIKNDILKNVTTKSLTVSATEGGTVEPAGTFTMLENGGVLTVSLSATEIPGYKFSGWTGDASGTTNPQPVVFDRTKSVTANFEQRKKEVRYLEVSVLHSFPGEWYMYPCSGTIVVSDGKDEIGRQYYDTYVSGATNNWSLASATVRIECTCDIERLNNITVSIENYSPGIKPIVQSQKWVS